MPSGPRYARLKKSVHEAGLCTVCEQARCPNLGECWQAGTATLMLLGNTCTRSCRFCAVRSGDPGGAVDPQEPVKAARAVERMGLDHVVLTMVTRDDLPDGGAAHLIETVRQVRLRDGRVSVEVLASDFAGSRQQVNAVVKRARPEVYAHNVEVVPALQRAMRDARCSWQRSLESLRWARQAGARVTKSSLMVGCGETDEQLFDAMHELRRAGVGLLTIGQYLRPGPRHARVVRYVKPERFQAFRQAALGMGFEGVAAGPLVRSSYRAHQLYGERLARGRAAPVGGDRVGGDRVDGLLEPAG
jgi:lipoic acid synthetase